MDQHQLRQKPFYIDQSPLVPAHFIFDKTYRNQSEKKKIEKDPKFTYYNTLLKMRNNYMSNKKDLYSHIFSAEKPIDEGDWKYSEKVHPYQVEIQPQQTFHVQKINNHAFKIHKGKLGSKANPKFLMNMTSTDSMNFKINFRNTKHSSKPQIEQVMKDYRKMNESFVNKNPIAKISTADIATSSRRAKSSHKYSFIAQGNFKGFQKGKNRSMTTNKIDNQRTYFKF